MREHGPELAQRFRRNPRLELLYIALQISAEE